MDYADLIWVTDDKYRNNSESYRNNSELQMESINGDMENSGLFLSFMAFGSPYSLTL